uniref:Uncharacterized protein n=1 Tax=Meloidogyne enterolobii TaxID=390850 RepID=A0A6V7TV92_MELEN|nr:unnamed protein product [Meloidogyne enterolobii]
MFEFLKCWFSAICKFIEETVRLQGYGAIPYLMAINSLFCFVCFYASREVQLRVLYSLVGSILVKDLLLTKKRQHPMLAVLSWCFADVFRSISVGFFLYSVHILTEGVDERKAFFASLAAVFCLIISPVYHHHQTNEKLAYYAKMILNWLKNVLIYLIIQPILWLWEWTKFLFLFRWMPILTNQLLNLLSTIKNWVNLYFWQPICTFGNFLKLWFQYLFYFYWFVDLWNFTKSRLLNPLFIQLERLLDFFVYIFGCYWLKPALLYIGRTIGHLIKSTFGLIWRASKSLASQTFIYLIWPIFLMVGNQLSLMALLIYSNAIYPLIIILYGKYKKLEDLVLINLLGPLVKKILDKLPQRNPLENSEHEFDEFLPSDFENEEENEQQNIEISENRINNQRENLQGGNPKNNINGLSLDELDSISSQLSFDDEEEAHALLSGLRQIDISESDSDTDAFLPSFAIKKRQQQQNDKNLVGEF